VIEKQTAGPTAGTASLLQTSCEKLKNKVPANQVSIIKHKTSLALLDLSIEKEQKIENLENLKGNM
jgi:hypothetical protein